MLGRALWYQTKLQKHLDARDVDRVRDYLAHIIMEWPDSNQCPIDFELIKKSMKFVQETFRFNPKAKTIKEVFIRRT